MESAKGLLTKDRFETTPKRNWCYILYEKTFYILKVGLKDNNIYVEHIDESIFQANEFENRNDNYLPLYTLLIEDSIYIKNNINWEREDWEELGNYMKKDRMFFWRVGDREHFLSIWTTKFNKLELEEDDFIKQMKLK